MRILAIRGCNLASLAGEFEIDLVDGPLGGAGVFAIVGPTGAGKSTLLDAMCVALFDRTPRLGNRSTVVVGKDEHDPAALGSQDVRTILRRGASAGWAEVDFESGDARRYRARWSVRRARGSTEGNLQDQQITLTALGGSGERFGGTKMETLRAIHQRLGLTFDQFRRSALLAQGEFAAFLRAEGRDRSELLERMTGTEIYSKLSIAAHTRAALAEQQLRERHGAALAIAVLAPEARTQAEAELELAKLAREAARTRLAAAELIARWASEAAARRTALGEAEREHAAAVAAVEAADPVRQELGLRRRAEGLRGAYDRVARIDREHAVARSEHAAADASVEAAQVAQRDIAARRSRIADLHEPIRAARIAAGIVEGVASRDSRPNITRSDEPTSRASRPRLASGTDATELLVAPFDPRSLDAAERAGQGAVEPALWLAERHALAPEIAAWPELDAKLGQFRTLADGIAATDATIGEHVAARDALVAKHTALVALRDAAREQLELATREAERYLARRTLSLDAAGRAEDMARSHAAEVDKLVAIADRARAAAVARAELVAQAEELDRAGTGDAARRESTLRDRDAAALLRDERARVVAEMRRIAGYDHARAELVDGEPCPLCGAAEHPWQSRGAVDALIADAERTHVAAVSQWNIAVATLAQLDARVAARDLELARIASARAAVEADVETAATIWRAQLAALGELVFATDPATPEAAQLARGRADLARARLEAARTARSEAVAASKAISDAQARVQVCQAEHDHHQTALRALVAEMARVDASIERLAGERVGKAERRADLARELAAAIARWIAALPIVECARLVPGIAVNDVPDIAVNDVVANGIAVNDVVPDIAVNDVVANGIAVNDVVPPDIAAHEAAHHVAAAGIAAQDMAAHDALLDKPAQLDGLAGVTVVDARAAKPKRGRGKRGAPSASDTATHVGHDPTRRSVPATDATRGATHVGRAPVDPMVTAAAIDREALRSLVAAWRTRADVIVAAETALTDALAGIDRAIATAERAVAEAATRHAELGKRAGELGALLATATTALDDARIGAGFDRDALHRLLGESAARVDELAAELDQLDRGVDRARTRVGERRRLVDDHDSAKPSAATISTANLDGNDARGDARDGTNPANARTAERSEVGELAEVARTSSELVVPPAVLVELAAAVATADQHAATIAATLAADSDARARRDAALAQFATAERAAEIDRVLGEVIGSHDGKLFRSFAQSLTLDSLLAVANSHLDELAPRYQLERVPKHDLELQVVDRDFGSEVRSVQSLSGGESFLVSLALALGLSSMSAHDVRVRTLLIDEGFGTLDPATLDSALAVLDELQATGRQVGVISHVPALIDRVRAHVRVLPKGGGRSEVIVPLN